MDIARAEALVKRLTDLSDAEIFESVRGNGNNLTLRRFQLGTAKSQSDPETIGSFQSMAVIEPSAPGAYFYMKMDANLSHNDWVKCKDPYGIELPRPASAGFFYWPAQSGLTIDVAFLKYGVFRTNRTNLSLSGGVNLSDGTTSPFTRITLAAATASAICAASTARNKIEFRNTLGEAIWLGNDNTVTDDNGAAPGHPIMPGEPYNWTSKDALYGYTVGGGAITIFTHSP